MDVNLYRVFYFNKNMVVINKDFNFVPIITTTNTIPNEKSSLQGNLFTFQKFHKR